ncbi:MAG: hypothetical protein FWC23_01220 [Chitinispirillia bacterium]|nr:hypothetical protein [Chitinispirillia bacterium]
MAMLFTLDEEIMDESAAEQKKTPAGVPIWLKNCQQKQAQTQEPEEESKNVLPVMVAANVFYRSVDGYRVYEAFEAPTYLRKRQQ